MYVRAATQRVIDRGLLTVDAGEYALTEHGRRAVVVGSVMFEIDGYDPEIDGIERRAHRRAHE